MIEEYVKTLNQSFTKFSSFLPLLNSVLDIFNFDLAVEFGPGIYSTPLLMNINKSYHIENDEKWYKLLKISYDFNNDNVLIHHKTKNLQDYISYYNNAVSEKIFNNFKLKLLMVDHYRQARKEVINILGNSFDVILYHDSEFKLNNYNQINKSVLNNFKKYELRFSKLPHTGLLVNKKLDAKKNIHSVTQLKCKEYLSMNSITDNKVKLYEIK